MCVETKNEPTEAKSVKEIEMNEERKTQEECGSCGGEVEIGGNSICTTCDYEERMAEQNFEFNLVRVREINRRVYTVYVTIWNEAAKKALLEGNTLDDLTGWEMVGVVVGDEYSGEREVELTFEQVR